MNNYFKKFSTLLSGVVVAQLLNIIMIPVLSRLYSPDAFGELSLFISLTGILGLISTLKLNEAVMITKNTNEMYKLIGSIIFFLLNIIIVITIAFIFLSATGIFEINYTMLLLLTLNLIFFAIYNTNTIYLTKLSEYKNVSKANIDRSIGLNITQFGLYNLPLFNGLLLGNVVGNFFGAFRIIKDVRNYKKFVNYNTFIQIVSEYNHFPKYNLPQALLGNLSSALPSLLLIYPFGAANIGLYYMCLKLINLPTTLISNTVTNLFYKEASSRNNNDSKLWSYFTKTTLLLGSIIIVPTIILVLIGGDLINLILGEEWIGISKLVPWIALWSATMFVYAPTIKLIIVKDWQMYGLIYSVFTFVFRLGFIIYGIKLLTFNETIIMLSFFNTCSNLLLILLVNISLYWKERFL